jgi:hypothetical protein
MKMEVLGRILLLSGQTSGGGGMKSLHRYILGALITASVASGLLLGTQAAGATSSSTPAPTVTGVVFGSELSTAGGSQDNVGVYGTNFVDVTAIDFGGVPGTDLMCYNSETCDVDAPPRATPGTVLVTVTAAGGTSATYNGTGDEATYYYPLNMTVSPALLSLSPFTLGLFTLTATVTRHGAPVPAGMLVVFGTETSAEGGSGPPGYEQWCTTTTNASGVATCSALTDSLTIIENNGYFAETEGGSNANFAEASAPLLSL